jgi:hypothetical protein
MHGFSQPPQGPDFLDRQKSNGLTFRSWIHRKPRESELLGKSEHEVDVLKRNASLPF